MGTTSSGSVGVGLTFLSWVSDPRGGSRDLPADTRAPAGPGWQGRPPAGSEGPRCVGVTQRAERVRPQRAYGGEPASAAASQSARPRSGRRRTGDAGQCRGRGAVPGARRAERRPEARTSSLTPCPPPRLCSSCCGGRGAGGGRTDLSLCV